MPKEAKARIRINKLLEEAGWRFFDTPEGKANVLLETNTKLTEEKLNDLESRNGVRLHKFTCYATVLQPTFLSKVLI